MDAKQLAAVEALKEHPIKKNNVNSLSPELRTAAIVKAKAAYRRQLEFLMKNTHRLYSTARKAKCLLHDGECHMSWQGLPGKRVLSWNMSGPVCVAHTRRMEAGLD